MLWLRSYLNLCELYNLGKGIRIYGVDVSKYPLDECPICCSLDTIDEVQTHQLVNNVVIKVLPYESVKIFRCSYCKNIFIG